MEARPIVCRWLPGLFVLFFGFLATTTMDANTRYSRYRQLQQYVAWTDEDAQRVRSVRRQLEASFPQIGDDFYAEINRHAETRSVLSGAPEQVTQLKGSLNKWLHELLSGPYDADYVDRRWRIGCRHVEIGLDPLFTTAALARLRQGLLRSLAGSLQSDPQELTATTESLNKLLDLELALLVEAVQSEHAGRLKNSERARSAKEAESREATLSTILNTSVDGIITIDEEGLITAANPAAEKMFGYATEGMIGANIAMLMPSPYREKHDGYLASYQETGKRNIIGVGREVSGLHRDGTVFPIELSVSEMTLGNRKMFTGIVRDITQRRQADEQLRLLSTAIADLEEGVVITDARLDWPGPTILFANQAMTKITRYTQQELVGKTPRIFQGTKTNRKELGRLKQELKAGRSYTGENTNYGKDGTQFEVELHISPVHDHSGSITHFVSTHREISERKRTEEQLLRGERLAAIGKAMMGLAHESRNALQRSQASLEMLRRRIENQPENVLLADRIQAAQDDLHRLYEEVREYAAPVRISPQRCHLDKLLHAAWDQLALRRADNKVQILEVVNGVDLSCSVDTFAICQVFRNVLENALAAGGEPVQITAEFSDARINDRPALEVRVRDNGPGLTAEERDRIFEEFFTTKTHGTGLGMAISKRNIEAHGGGIVVGDNTTDGAEIVITLPRNQS